MEFEAKELKEYVEKKYTLYRVVYLDLYVKRVKLLVYSNEFDQYIDNQIPYVVSKDNEDRYDASIVLWKEIDEDAPEFINSFDQETNTYYYGVKNLDYEEFIKQGHFLVQIFYKILKTDHSSLVHGAVIGMDNEGVLLCARGQRGKSTLTVLSLFKGAEYVSDDYLVLEKDKDGNIFASPIYSIITLSPIMTEKMKDNLVDAKKLGENARKDKYVFNIANMHPFFRKHYPIKFLMFPEIVDIEETLIRKATQEEKNRAMTQLIHSTTSQMYDTKDRMTTIKLISMVNKYNCYYIGLAKNIDKNAETLLKFIKERGYKKL